MNAKLDPRDLLDRQLGRVTMYRLITIVLLVLAAVYVIFSATGVIDGLSTKDHLISLVVLVVASYASSRLFGLIWRVRPHGESSVITALLLFFLYVPLFEANAENLAWLAGAAVLGNASKYVLAWRGRHIFNPAAAGAFLTYVVQDLVGRESPINAIWQTAATKQLFPFIVVGAFLVLWRTRRLDIGLIFIVLAGAMFLVGYHDLGQSWADALEATSYSTPVVFLAGFMLSEPLTLPPRRHQQWMVAVVVSVVAAYPIFGYVLMDTPETLGVDSGQFLALSLLIGNLLAFAFARRHGVTFVLEETRELTPEIRELTFRAKRPVSFEPGQFAELTVPHAGVDGRGSRRSFSIASPPQPDGRVSFALRVPDNASSFKKALLALEPGDTVHATGIGGDFVLPPDPSEPLLLVAGGIGITPFLSQLRHESSRDAVLVYGVSSPDEVPFVEELAGVRVVLVGPASPGSLPEGWTYVEAPFLSPELIAEAVPDLADRRAYVSGPPAMVNAVRAGLAKRCKGVKTDYFTGY